jgi:hypothetical protein
MNYTHLSPSVADPDDFCPDPGPDPIKFMSRNKCNVQAEKLME